MTITKLNTKDLKDKLDKKEVVVIDVRTQKEFEDHHIGGSYNIPLDVLKDYKKNLNSLNKKPIFVCKSGVRSTKACQLIEDGALDLNVSTLDGGLDHWEEEKLEVIHGKSFWPIERQVRLVAGSLVTLGIILSFIIDFFKFLSLFIGLGLIFAAITNTCGMGLLLSKMPWNKSKENEKYKHELEKLFSHH